MDIEKIIRKLSKSNKWQTIFSLTKEAGFPIFENTTDYTEYQILFLNFLSFYYNLYTEVALNDIPLYIFKDEIYEDAYMYYKRKEKVKDYSASLKPQDNKQQTKQEPDFTWVLKRPPKSEKK